MTFVANSTSFLILQVNAAAELRVLTEAAPVLSIADLKKLRRSSQSRSVVLQLDPALISVHKIYLDEKFEARKSLPERLWQELDVDHFNLSDVFYDYVEVESSLLEHRAYQFVFVARRGLAPALRQLRQAFLWLVKITVVEIPELNLLPWRERAVRMKIVRQGLRLFLLPVLLMIGLLGYWQVLEQRNEALSQQLASTYQQGLAQQVGNTQTLNSFMPAFTLLQALPEGVSVNSFTLSKSGWALSGELSNLEILAQLNEQLTALHWLEPGMSVDVHEVDQHYLWQVKKASVTHAS